MADPNMNKTPEDMKKNETMQREQGQQSGQQGFDKDRKAEQGGFDKNRQPEKGADKEREEKSAIGGGESQQGQSPTGQQSGQQSDRNRSEPTSR